MLILKSFPLRENYNKKRMTPSLQQVTSVKASNIHSRFPTNIRNKKERLSDLQHQVISLCIR